jgi:beta-lactam-binding protein with PASTA domain
VFGGDIAAPIWKDLMQTASEGLPIRQFDEPSKKILDGDTVSVPYVSGLTIEAATAKLKEAGFLAQVAGQTSSGLAQGLVVYTNPSGSAIRGSTIGLYTSSGYVPTPRPPTTPQPTKTKKPKPGKTPTPPPTPRIIIPTPPSGTN